MNQEDKAQGEWRELTESISEKIYEIDGVLVLKEDAKISEIVDKIRSLPGVTRVQSDKLISQATLSNRNKIHFKFRPVKALRGFILDIKRNIVHIEGVSGFHVAKTRRYS